MFVYVSLQPTVVVILKDLLFERFSLLAVTMGNTETSGT